MRADMTRDNTQNKSQAGFHVIIAAAGSGRRMGGDVPKQYAPLCGKPVLRRTLEAVAGWAGAKSVRVIIDPNGAFSYQNSINDLKMNLSGPVRGGAERHISVRNALRAAADIGEDEIVLIHDAARPFARAEDVRALLAAMQTYRAASLAVPVSDTLRRDDGVVDREGMWALQTPQAFYFGDLKKAHEQAAPDAHYTDDTSLMSAAGFEVKMVTGSKTNIKLTTPEDWEMAEAFLLRHAETRTGTGFDVHAFEAQASGKPLKLCGVSVVHERALEGHSDADVGLHALTDALLGAIGQGDIGQHFPPSDPAFKDMDSAVFLERAMDMVRAAGGMVQNLDVTLICEAPKIGPHREAMRTKVAEICGIDPARVNVKATTTERLGFTGRGEGIAAQAVATLKLVAG